MEFLNRNFTTPEQSKRLVEAGVTLSWGWLGTCRLNKAKKILKTIRQEYILQECERIRKERLFKNNKKEYENFKKYIESL